MSMEQKRRGGQPGGSDESLIPKHGGYRSTKTWQLADLIYDVTVRFCDKFVDQRSRTHDQMVQAARSGCQNLAEGSVDSAISKKSEMKLTGIAKGSLEELRQDYRKFLAHRSLPEWPPEHPALQRFRALRCATLEQFRAWVAKEARPGADAGLCGAVSAEALPSVLAANGALALLNVCIYLVGRQLDAQAAAFEREGGFTERLCRTRQSRRTGS
jgi:four helix bundle suffix protein